MFGAIAACSIAAVCRGVCTSVHGASLALTRAGLGDLNSDGTPDIAVGAPGGSDGGSGRGAVYILFLTPTGTVSAYQKISDTEGSFSATLADSDAFGTAIAGQQRMHSVGCNCLIDGSIEPSTRILYRMCYVSNWRPDRGWCD